jgi:peptidoglycan hydrolase CwlO-like protein
MKYLALITMLVSNLSWSIDYGYLKEEDQKFYKNESFSGKNQVERVDENVKQINKLYGEISSLKAEIVQIKKELEELKKK